MQEFGLHVDSLILDNRPHKCQYKDEKKSRQSGWYAVRQFNIGGRWCIAGTYGSFRLQEKPLHIQSGGNWLFTKDQKIEFRNKLLRNKKIEHEKKIVEHQRAAQRAQQIWEASDAVGQSDYLTRKHVQAHGIRFHGNSIIVPMGKEGRMTSLQCISPDGRKKFLPGGEISGCFFDILGKGKIALCEGYATGASIHEATGWTVVICFSASGLVKVAPYFKGMNGLVVCADNDIRSEAITGINTGIESGCKAASTLGCPILFPEEGDWNDWHVLKGIEEVKRCLMPLK